MDRLASLASQQRIRLAAVVDVVRTQRRDWDDTVPSLTSPNAPLPVDSDSTYFARANNPGCRLPAYAGIGNLAVRDRRRDESRTSNVFEKCTSGRHRLTDGHAQK